VDEPAVMRGLLDSGVDAVITDRPDVLREVLIQRGTWQAAGAAQLNKPSSADLGSVLSG